MIWVPTPQTLVDKMLDMAKVTPKDYVMDLGSGDGRTGDYRREARRQSGGSNTTRIWWSYRSATPPKKASTIKPVS